MQEYFEIYPSRAQLGLLVGGHALLALAIVTYVEPVALMLPGIALVGLLGSREFTQLSRLGNLVLHCNRHTAEIALECGDQPYFYVKYKVYATRWFAILKLIDKHQPRTLILNPDRFDSAHEYHRLRYLLVRMEQSGAA